ncbi:hypothetical protein BSR29_06625 [Boudabousia liubingyangii]|uniref:Peptidase n=1 Tax=Boudabousia liubingyangii TaxID=1921764 RepID=A0A1Q5PL20_9ACTO|nr:hypothetical protein BSR28_07655 [Boudabousia liubingyangii]OKL47327.1 hypothetical protein BSR29_06625 [Boudabousia liubingyangii]
MHRRDRHGRTQRGPLIGPHLPGYISRQKLFDDLVVQQLQSIETSFPQLNQVEVVVEEAPRSDPAPWERDSIRLGRAFSADRKAGLPSRIVLFRLPISDRCDGPAGLSELIRLVLVENLSALFGCSPEDIDPSI